MTCAPFPGPDLELYANSDKHVYGLIYQHILQLRLYGCMQSFLRCG